MERDTFRWDEPNEQKCFFVACQDCQWVSDAESTEEDLPSLEVCPECEGGNLEVESEYA